MQLVGFSEGSVQPTTWPQQMSLEVDALPHPILELLYLRSAWKIAADIELPELEPTLEKGKSQLPDAQDRFLWEVRWKKQWKQAWNARIAGQYRVPGTQTLSAGNRAHKPADSWRAEYGVAGFDDSAYERWVEQIRVSAEQLLAGATRHELIEPVIIAAWERGLEQMTVLPWQGFISLRLGESHLVTSLDTIGQAQKFRAALAQWITDCQV